MHSVELIRLHTFFKNGALELCLLCMKQKNVFTIELHLLFQKLHMRDSNIDNLLNVKKYDLRAKLGNCKFCYL